METYTFAPKYHSHLSLKLSTLTEASDAAGLRGMAVVDSLDAARDAIDQRDEYLSDVGKLISPCYLDDWCPKKCATQATHNALK